MERSTGDMQNSARLALGANLLPEGGCAFRVWTPSARSVRLKLTRRAIGVNVSEEIIDMPPQADGYFAVKTMAVEGDRYTYIVDEHPPLPDPVSRLLPEGVHGATEIVDPAMFEWADGDWRGLPLTDYIIYELHVGAFTAEGTFDAVIGRLPYLKQLGVTAVELMPVAAFPGERNWGYDGVSLFAVQSSYGGPTGLRRLVNAAHASGLAVVLDVVYNHLGNEGNYLRNFAPYFTDLHVTPWGDAVNYDAPGAQGVREFVLQNAAYWLREYHMDGLRLDAVQTIHDDSPKHILAEIKESAVAVAEETNRKICIIAESDENDARLVRTPAKGGFGLDAFWSDDFHHCVHTLLTHENAGYYQDFGELQQLARALESGYVFQGEPFRFWGRPRGTKATDVQLPANVICIQNHDQVGNRAKGERLTELCSFAQRQAAAALLLLAPHTPLLFMGQEFDETSPFLFFTSFEDASLVKAVRKGRREEFKEFAWNEVPDPQDAETFLRSKLDWDLTACENPVLDWYRALIQLRKEHVTASERGCRAEVREGVLHMQVPAEDPRLHIIANLNGKQLPPAPHGWKAVLSAADEHASIMVLVREHPRG